jgi:hypothetical protein
MGGAEGVATVTSGSTSLNDVWKSTDGGSTWVLITATAQWAGSFYFNPITLYCRPLVVFDCVSIYSSQYSYLRRSL